MNNGAVFVLLFCFHGLVLPSIGETIRWSPTAESTLWTDSKNWEPAVVPSSVDDVIIRVSSPLVIHIINDTKSCNFQVGSLFVEGDCEATDVCVDCLKLVVASGCTLEGSSYIIVGEQAGLFLEGSNLSASKGVFVEGSIGGEGAIIGDVAVEGGLIYVESLLPDEGYYVSIGELAVQGNLRLNYTTLAMDIISGTEYDKITIQGTLEVITTSTIWLGVPETLEELQGRSIQLITATQVIGEMAILQEEKCQGTFGPIPDMTTRPITPVQLCEDDPQQGPGVVILFPDTSGGCCQSDCSLHGTCTAGVCMCDAGYTGNNCQLIDCPGEPNCLGRGTCTAVGGEPTCGCITGWGGPDCSVAICPGTPQCSGNGMCYGFVDPPQCDCSLQYTGPDCSEGNPNPDSCHNGGTYVNGSCLCPEKWTGTSCQFALTTCPGTPVCSGINQGICNTSTVDINDHHCICLGFWESEDCSQQSEDACGDCGEHGSCETDIVPAVCSCDSGWTGEDCSVEANSSSGFALVIIVVAAVVFAGTVLVVGGIMLFLKRKDSKMEKEAMELE